MSRNNDIDGYWGPGMLYLLANQQGESALSLVLLGNKTEETSPIIEIVEKHYREILARNLEKAGFDASRVKGAKIEIAFETHGELKEPVFYTRGKPFSARSASLATWTRLIRR